MSLKGFFDDKQMMLEWAQFIQGTLDDQVLERVYAGKETAGYKEARDIIAKSFAKLKDQFTSKPKPPRQPRAE
jgi:hypothetical protein